MGRQADTADEVLTGPSVARAFHRGCIRLGQPVAVAKGGGKGSGGAGGGGAMRALRRAAGRLLLLLGLAIAALPAHSAERWVWSWSTCCLHGWSQLGEGGRTQAPWMAALPGKACGAGHPYWEWQAACIPIIIVPL